MSTDKTVDDKVRIHSLTNREPVGNSEEAAALEKEGLELLELMIEGKTDPAVIAAAQDELAQKMARLGIKEINVEMPPEHLDESGNVVGFDGLEADNLAFEQEHLPEIEETGEARESADGEYVDFDDVAEAISNAGLEAVDLMRLVDKEGDIDYAWYYPLEQTENQLSRMANLLVDTGCVPSMSIFCQMVARVQIAEQSAAEAASSQFLPKRYVKSINKVLFYIREAETKLGII